MENFRRRLILGGGISGLTCANELRRQGDIVTVLESQGRPGGAIRSIIEDGYLAETGPNTFQVTSKRTEEFLRNLDLEPMIVQPNVLSQKRYVVRDKRLHAVPSGVWSGITTRLFRFRGKLRLLSDLVIPRRLDNAEESMADFVRRRIGAEFLDYALNPMVGGVYAGDPEKLSIQHAFPKVYQLEQDFGGLIKGAIRKQWAAKPEDSVATRMISFCQGMETLPNAINRKLGDAVTTNAEVLSIVELDDGQWSVSWRVEGSEPKTRTFDTIVVAVPAHRISCLPWSTGMAPQMAIFATIQYPPVAAVSLGFDRRQVEHPLDGFGMLIPENQRRSILGTLFTSSMFEGRAPAGKVNLTSFVGGARQPELARLSEKELIGLVLKDIGELLGIDGHFEFSKVTKWERAIPQYNLGYGAILDAMQDMERRWNGLYFCGNYRNGISVEKCITSALELAQGIQQNRPV